MINSSNLSHKLNSVALSENDNSVPLPVPVAFHDVGCGEVINVKDGSMLSAFLHFRNATNNIQLSDYVDNYREREPRDTISFETKRVLKKVLQAKPAPEGCLYGQPEKSGATRLIAPKPNGRDTAPGASLGDVHLQRPTIFPQRHAILRIKQVIERTGLSRSTLYNKLSPGSKYYDPSFPKQIKLTSFLTGWLESEITEWIESRINISRCGRKTD